ncbi:protein-L-isoaspartate(D-aspartate) O-methyltransferase [Streptomyces poriferorum]|uniref:Protein-L-isoaspartate(D-aspartate) O-methyltransferase n=1 Tax=Streptomyces poriferorum TaxID=2798799 RepID=A0ABY9J125_9ACTN|nr:MULTISPECIES: protein-L-isoaspartate(D-aspartate) O-methyltransferase [unclassified Streptomyces]MDP5309399.1 protein-L-isoaspartate(D-aspartate) O-methyltransferase [Streptomyces sp. Alt4]WLQ61401.1 protein-L-isoaspartate(D-aspartate) O-methyltransferase [Streptomyces sp. Alt2]
MDWETHARRLADEVVRSESRWHGPLATTPRHVFVPRWWRSGEQGWELRDGAADTDAWMASAYADRTLVTRVGALHADDAEPGAVMVPGGYPTSSSTLPGLVVAMHRHAMVTSDARVLVTTGSGYGTALMCHRLGDDQVTSVDVDPHLVGTARDRLASIGLRPHLAAADITGPLPGEYDRIISTVSVRPVPTSWLEALRPGGRLVTTIAGTGLILTADKTADGGAAGRIQPDPAGFMRARHGVDYGPPANEVWAVAECGDGEEVTTCRYPLLYPTDAWDVMSMLALAVPDIEYRCQENDDSRTVWLLHADGSWARATATEFLASPTVHQGGPRRLWRELERIRNRLNRMGTLPIYGARATITPDGVLTLSRGGWTATV